MREQTALRLVTCCASLTAPSGQSVSAGKGECTFSCWVLYEPHACLFRRRFQIVRQRDRRGTNGR